MKVKAIDIQPFTPPVTGTFTTGQMGGTPDLCAGELSDSDFDVSGLWEIQPDRHGSVRSVSLIAARQSFQNRRYGQVLRDLENLPREDAESLNLRGLAHELLSDFQAASRDYGRALSADKNYWAAEMNLRRCYELYTFGNSEIPMLF